MCAEGEVVGDSGSIVFRSIGAIVSYAEVQRKIVASRKGKLRAREKKEMLKEMAAKRKRGEEPAP